MSDEPTERDVEALIAVLESADPNPKWAPEQARAVLASDWYAERIAEARRESAADTASLLRRARDRIRHDHAYPMEVGPHHCDGCDLRDEIDASLRGDDAPPPDHAPTGGPISPFGPFDGGGDA